MTLEEDEEKLALLRRTMPSYNTKRKLVRCIDLCSEYFDTYLRQWLMELGAHLDA
jgi:hypothetical protein